MKRLFYSLHSVVTLSRQPYAQTSLQVLQKTAQTDVQSLAGI